MKTASDIMTKRPVTIGPDEDVVKAAKIMLENHYNGLPVVDVEGFLLGVVTQSDLIATQKRINAPSLFTVLDGVFPLASLSDFEQELKKASAASVKQAMTEDVVTITPDTPVEELASLMVDKKLYTLPVVEDGKLVGVVGKEDVLRLLAGGS